MKSIRYERNRNKLFLLFFIISLLLVLQDVLYQYAGIFKWADEFVGAALIPFTFFVYISKKPPFYKEEKIILAAFLFMLSTGLLSSLIYRYQGINAILADLIIVSKFIGAYFLSRVIFYEINLKEYFKYIKAAFQIITFAAFSAVAADIVLGIFPKDEGRKMLIYSEQLMFSHPTYLAVFSIEVLAFLTLVSENKLKDKIFIAMIMLVCASCLRAKAIGLLIFYLFFILAAKKLEKIKISYIIAASLLVFLIFIPQITTYYSNDESARSALTAAGFKIANSFFPIGAGFGTFGSYFSGVYYSPLYYQYGINTVWGLGKRDYSFVADTFWPMIIGQFGYIGLCAFAVIILCFLLLIRKMAESGTNTMFFALIPFIYLLISSTSESSYVNSFSVIFFIITGMAVNQIKYRTFKECPGNGDSYEKNTGHCT